MSKSIRTIAFLAVCFWPLAALAIVSDTVTVKDSGKPLPGATITISTHDRVPAKTYRTSRTGTARIRLTTLQKRPGKTVDVTIRTVDGRRRVYADVPVERIKRGDLSFDLTDAGPPGAPPSDDTPPTAPPWWTGSSVGLQVTGACSTVTTREFVASTGVQSNAFRDSCTGVGGGIGGGYSWAIDRNVLAGFLLELNVPNDKVQHNFAGGTFIGSIVNVSGSALGKVGFLPTPPLLLYALAGLSVANQRLQINFGGPFTDQSRVTPGGTIGAGAEYAFMTQPGSAVKAWSLFAQYEHTWWATARLATPVASPFFNYSWLRQSNLFEGGVRLHF